MTDPTAAASIEPGRAGLTRRDLLRGAGAVLLVGGSAAALAACGDDTAAPAEPTDLLLLPTFDANGSGFRADRPVRATYSLAGSGGTPRRELPDGMTVVVSTEGEGGSRRTILGPVPAVVRAEGIPVPYLAVTFTPDRSGYYFVTVTVEGQELDSALFVPPTSVIPAVGDPLPPTATATVADPAGVEPLCTRTPECPFHAVSLDEALAGAGPTVLVVSTPAFCQTGVCGPTLDLLVERTGLDPGRVVHAEVYADAAEVGIFDATTVPLVGEFGLTFEPLLFVADAGGTIVARLDNLWDGSELDETLALVGL